MLEHGGRLNAASKKYGRPVEEWLDLSTGINPAPYPIPFLEPEIWRRLPQEDDGLFLAANQYYGTTDLLAVAGSQAAIQALPRFFKKSKVGFCVPSYNEHRHAWQQSGHELIQIDERNIASQTSDLDLDILLLCNPNNPTGTLIETKEIEDCLSALRKKNGTMIIDEAFMDATPEKSMLSLLQRYSDCLVVLRSLGKFFGLAGARVGFVAANRALLSALQEYLGPWSISGPARFVSQHALQNFDWQQANRLRLQTSSQALRQELVSAGLTIAGSTNYFAYVKQPGAKQLHEHLCQRGILTRYFETPDSLRFGLAGSESELLQLREALKSGALELNRFCSPSL